MAKEFKENIVFDEESRILYSDNFDTLGPSARFLDMAIKIQEGAEEQPGFLEWHGKPEVIGVNSDINGIIGNLAGILTSAETAVLVDLPNKKIIREGDSFNIAFMNNLKQTKDPKRDEEIMALYEELIAKK